MVNLGMELINVLPQVKVCRNLVIQINAIVDQTITALQEYKDTEFMSLIVNGLADAKSGIANLAITYSHRPETVAQINVCIITVSYNWTRTRNI